MEESEHIQANLYNDQEIKNQDKKPKEDLSKKGIQKLIEDGLIKPTKKQKQLGIKFGFIKMAGIDAAKVDLKKNGYNVAELLKKHPEWSELEVQLQKYSRKHKENIKHINKKAGLNNEEEKETQMAQIDIKFMFADQLQGQSTEAEWISILTNQNKQHPIDFYQYWLKAGSQKEKYIQALAKVIENENDLQQKLRIFLGICGLYKCNELEIDVRIFPNMLTYLATYPDVTPKQAGGFMKLSFEKEVGLPVEFPLHIVRRFDKDFSKHFDSFKQRLELEQWESQMIFTQLPDTCMLLSVPMIKALKTSSSFNGIYSGHLKNVLIILTYSFPINQELFNELLQNLKNSTKSNIERMETTYFQQFLDELAIKLLAFDQRWF